MFLDANPSADTRRTMSEPWLQPEDGKKGGSMPKKGRGANPLCFLGRRHQGYIYICICIDLFV